MVEVTETPTPKTGFSPIITLCFTYNVVVGAGFVTIPYAFVSGGLVASSVAIIVLGVLLDMTKDYLLEASAFAEAMLDSNLQIMDEQTRSQQVALLSSEPATTTTTVPSLNPTEEAETGAATPSESVVENNHKYVIKERKFEINLMCKTYLGNGGYFVYTVAYSLFGYCVLWAWASIFASALSGAITVLSNPNMNYLFFVVLFGFIVVPITCLELTEQVTFQVTLTICRFIMMILMVSTSNLCAKDLEAYDANLSNDVAMVNFSKLYITLPIIVLSQIFHAEIPVLCSPIQEKKNAGSVFQVFLISTAVLYLVTGITLGLSFGNSTEESANLNWVHFHAGTGTLDEHGEIVGAAVWTQLIRNYIVLFPTIDALSAFPLNGIVLGNCLLGAAMGDRVHEAERHRPTVVCFRLMAALPPLLLGSYMHEIGTITDYTGTFGIMIGLAIPSWLFLKSRAMAKRENFATVTQYTTYASNSVLAYSLSLFGVIAFFICLGSIIAS